MPIVNTDKLTQLYGELGHDEHTKAAFHKEAKKVFNAVASRLGLAKGAYSVRASKGGSGSGEIVLHTDNLYMQISKSFFSTDTKQLYRSCEGQKDLTGGTNQWVEIERLLDEDVISKLERIQNAIAA